MKRPIETIVITKAMLAASAERARHTAVPSGSPMDCPPHPNFPLDEATKHPVPGVDCREMGR